MPYLTGGPQGKARHTSENEDEQSFFGQIEQVELGLAQTSGGPKGSTVSALDISSSDFPPDGLDEPTLDRMPSSLMEEENEDEDEDLIPEAVPLDEHGPPGDGDEDPPEDGSGDPPPNGGTGGGDTPKSNGDSGLNQAVSAPGWRQEGRRWRPRGGGGGPRGRRRGQGPDGDRRQQQQPKRPGRKGRGRRRRAHGPAGSRSFLLCE